MKNIRILCSFMFTVCFFAFLTAFNLMAKAETTDKVIIVFKDDVSQQSISEITAKYNLQNVKKLNAVKGESGNVSHNLLKSLKNEASVKYVVNDDIVSLLKTDAAVTADTLPWGVDTVNAEQVWSNYTGAGIKVAIVDTGIDIDHPDLVANIKGGINIISPSKSFDDDNGHGTHVAGTVAAADNEIGVVGVAPQAQLYGVKVLNRKGSGYTSDIISGIEWAVTNKMNIISMSLGSAYYNAALEEAVNYAHDNGVIIVAAAGNESTSVSYPAAYANVIAVSATDESNVFAYFSNFGPEVDCAAPGVNILSTYYKGQYAYMSGTSMSTPHVSGVIALMLQAGTAVTDDDVIREFATGCIDLGTAGKDNYYGYGIVDASLLTR